MVYCAGKLIKNLKLFYKSNRPHFLWVHWHDNTLMILRLTSSEQTTKFPAHSELLKQQRKTFDHRL